MAHMNSGHLSITELTKQRNAIDVNHALTAKLIIQFHIGSGSVRSLDTTQPQLPKV